MRDGAGGWIINGHKMWTSQAKYADYIWLAARTDKALARHRGLSVFAVPTDLPGFSYTTVHTVAGVTTAATYYDDVHVPGDALIGEVNGGWALITNQLNHERVALFSSAVLVKHIREVAEWAAETRGGESGAVIEQSAVAELLGQAHARTELLTLLNWKVVYRPSDSDPGRSLRHPGVRLRECSRGVPHADGRSRAGRRPDAGVTGAVLAGHLERYHRNNLIFTFGGGTNEIQRDMIGYLGLGLPACRG